MFGEAEIVTNQKIAGFASSYFGQGPAHPGERVFCV
jgi:hypothetical protein